MTSSEGATMTVSELISSVNGAADSKVQLNEDERLGLLAACAKLHSKLENPFEASIRFMFAPHQSIALRLAVDMKLFDAAVPLSADGGVIRIEELSSKIDADPAFVARILRFLVGMGIFNEVGPGTFTSTPLTGVYVTDSPLAPGVIHMTSQNEIISALPAYFAEFGYENPGDAYNGPFQYARNTKLHCFDWLATQPRLQHAFNVVMGISRMRGAQKWFEYFPVSSKLNVASPDETLLVDIGGGVGHDLIALKNANPDLQGRMIVQDIPVVIDSINNLPSGIQAMKHDFFGEQPVKGAKAYYLANVLHDWPDKQALKILTNVKEAMNPESILLINENVLPESKVSMYSASADLMMMANFSSLERTEKQFRALLDRARLELVKVWVPEQLAEGEGRRLLEVVPMEV